jgi:flagellar export protein FliJ
MKAFTFSLESVLTLRAREEDLAREAFALAVQARDIVGRQLAEGRATIEIFHDALAGCRTGSTNRSEQIILLNALQHHQSHCGTLAIRLAAAERETAAKRDAYLTARRKREALSRLKTRKLVAHRLAEERREEAAVADVIAARHARNLQEVPA